MSGDREPARPPCWGIGLGRTGTNSFCAALRVLGYERVAHNPRFEELAGLQGGADNGVLLFYKYLDYKFPGSKFVLTLRDLESWLDSMSFANAQFPILSRELDDVPIMRRMLTYETVEFDRDKFAAAYERHHADVRRYFAGRPGDLLEVDFLAGAGWEPLCAFLGLPVPAAPFPRLFYRERSDASVEPQLGPGFGGQSPKILGPKRAIVYAAWGERYIGEAVTSATTAALVGVDRLLITNAESRAFLRADAPFERVIEHAFQLPALLAKSEIFDLLPADYDSFVFLDTDTHVLLDIDQGFEKAETYGIAAAQATMYGLEHFWGFDAVLRDVGLRSREILQYNSGVLFFSRLPRAWEVLTKWHELCVNASGDVSAYTDQPYLTLAMELLGFNPYTLSIAYNYRNFGDIACGNIRIWHSHVPPPPDVNEFRDFPVRRFLDGQRLD